MTLGELLDLGESAPSWVKWASLVAVAYSAGGHVSFLIAQKAPPMGEDPDEWLLVAWGRGRDLIGSTCHFLWGRYSHCGGFQATSVEPAPVRGRRNPKDHLLRSPTRGLSHLDLVHGKTELDLLP